MVLTFETCLVARTEEWHWVLQFACKIHQLLLHFLHGILVRLAGLQLVRNVHTVGRVVALPERYLVLDRPCRHFLEQVAILRPRTKEPAPYCRPRLMRGSRPVPRGEIRPPLVVHARLSFSFSALGVHFRSSRFQNAPFCDHFFQLQQTKNKKACMTKMKLRKQWFIVLGSNHCWYCGVANLFVWEQIIEIEAVSARA